MAVGLNTIVPWFGVYAILVSQFKVYMRAVPEDVSEVQRNNFQGHDHPCI